MSEQQTLIRIHPEVSGWRTEKKPDQELVEDIKNNGLAVKLEARKLGDGSLEVYSGSRRYIALEALGWTPEQIEKEITIKENMSDEDVLIAAIASNYLRKDFTAVEEARAFNSLRKLKLSPKKIAAKVSKSESYVRDRLTILELPTAIQKRIVDGSIDVSYTPVLMKLKDFKEAQLELAKQISDKRSYQGIHSVKDAEEFISRIFAEKKRREDLLAKYGPCPSCGSTDINQEWGKDHLKCLKCKNEWNAETKEPWSIYELRREAAERGMKMEIVGPDKALLTPQDLTELVKKQREQQEANKEEEVSPNIRGKHTVTELLKPLIGDDNVLSMNVNNEEISLKLVQGVGVHFQAVTKDYKTGEKSKITADWTYDKDHKANVEQIKKLDETLSL